jgi:hypothetical protein
MMLNASDLPSGLIRTDFITVPEPVLLTQLASGVDDLIALCRSRKSIYDQRVYLDGEFVIRSHQGPSLPFQFQLNPRPMNPFHPTGRISDPFERKR